MNAQKIKSLFFFCSFVVAAIVYYNVEQKDSFNPHMDMSQTADLQVDNTDTLEDTELESLTE